MIKFFRSLRKRLIAEKQFTKYLLYAIGEIVLVVVGILIALQINNWNTQYKNRIKEKNYLVAIRTNLIGDRQQAMGAINFNKYKIEVIDSMLQLLNEAEESSDYMDYLIKNQRALSSFPTFEPVSTAFDNMMSSYDINMIQNDTLRRLLSEYYNYEWDNSPQSASRLRTRSFANSIFSKIIGEPNFHKDFEEVFKPMLPDSNNFKWVDDFSINFPDRDYLEFHDDREIIASMFIMIPTSIYQNRYIEDGIGRMDLLLEIIDREIEAKQ